MLGTITIPCFLHGRRRRGSPQRPDQGSMPCMSLGGIFDLQSVFKGQRLGGILSKLSVLLPSSPLLVFKSALDYALPNMCDTLTFAFNAATPITRQREERQYCSFSDESEG